MSGFGFIGFYTHLSRGFHRSRNGFTGFLSGLGFFGCAVGCIGSFGLKKG